MKVKERLQSLGDRWPWLGVGLAVQHRFTELGGGPLAGSITLSTFLSIFPLALLGISIVGFLSVNEEDFVTDVLEAFGLTGELADVVTRAIDAAADSRRTASIIGLLGLLWSGLAVVSSLSHALNRTWQVTGRGLLDRAWGVVWLIGTVVLVASGILLSSLGAWLPGPAYLATVPLGALLYCALFWWMFRVMGNAPIGWRSLLPGAIAAGIGFEVLNIVSGLIVPNLTRGSALYGSLGAVFAVLAWLFLFGRIVVYSSVLNVVLFERELGTVTVQTRAPRFPHRVALEANRGGAIDDAVGP
jgi:YihY family inner membrane protein